jgi:hypothetical protein
MKQPVLLPHYCMVQMQLMRARCKKNIYESKQDSWHLVEIRRPVKAAHADCFDDVFVWQRERRGDANTVPALLQTHITPKGTLLIKPCMF